MGLLPLRVMTDELAAKAKADNVKPRNSGRQVNISSRFLKDTVDNLTPTLALTYIRDVAGQNVWYFNMGESEAN